MNLCAFDDKTVNFFIISNRKMNWLKLMEIV